MSLLRFHPAATGVAASIEMASRPAARTAQEVWFLKPSFEVWNAIGHRPQCGQAGRMGSPPISKHEPSGIVPNPIAGFLTTVRALNVQEFPQFLFGLEVELLTAAFRPTRRVPELIGAKGDVWHFRHSIIQLNLANFRAALPQEVQRPQVQLPYRGNVPIAYATSRIRAPRIYRCF
jgi:hypothetical protein